MGSRLPVVSGLELVRALQRLGYEVARQSGSHVSLRCPGRPPLTIPMHATIARGTLRSILRAAGLSVDELVDLL